MICINKKVFILVIFAIVVLLIVGFFVVNSLIISYIKRPYESDYFGKIGSKETGEIITVTDAKYRFGKDSIGVGSSLQEIQWAYRHAQNVSGLGECEYNDRGIDIQFWFDDNAKVTKITFYWYGIFDSPNEGFFFWEYL